MNNKTAIIACLTSLMLINVDSYLHDVPYNDARSSHKASSACTKTFIRIILGSTRQNRTSDKIAQELKRMLDTRADIIVEIIDLRDYELPFLHDETAPASRQNITNPAVKKWSDIIKAADAFIIVVPEYNAGYPGVLKNALDTLYKEWNKKPIAFVGYSGGPSGGTSAVRQLREVTNALEMKPLDCSINIPHVSKAFDQNGNFNNIHIEEQLKRMVDHIVGQSQQTS